MRRPGGYALLIDPDLGTQENDTFTCMHCNKVVHVPPKAAATDCGAWCGRCGAPICKRCGASGICLPFEKKLDAYEARQRMLRSMGL